MASAYTNDLRLEEITTGEQSGTWGDTTNTNLELISEAFSFGTEAITSNADTHATVIADGATDPGRSMYLKYTGALDSTCTITISPNTVSKLWFIENATTDSGSSGPYDIIIKQGTGATVTIPNSHVKTIYSDGAGAGGAMVEAFTDLNVADSLTVSGTTITLGDGTAEDTKLVYDGNAKDFYVGLDDSADKLVIGEGSTVGTNNILTITDDTVTLGDGAAVDTAIVFDGNAQDFYIALDDSADDLLIGLGSTVGTTPIISVDENKDVAIPDGGLTITTSDNTDQLSLVSTDADANVGPNIRMYRNSSSPADNDYIGEIQFEGRNDNSQDVIYAGLASRIVDASDGTEDGRFELYTILAGAQNSRVLANSTETVINEDSVDLDFRVESNGNANMLFVDGGEDRLGVGTNAPSKDLHVKGGGASAFIRIDNTADGYDTGFEIYQNGSRLWELHSDDSRTNALSYRNNAGTALYEFSQSGTLRVGMSNIADPTLLIDSASGGDPTLVFDTGAANRNALIRFKDEGTVSGFINYAHNGNRIDMGAGSSTGVTAVVGDGVFFVGATAAVDGERAAISKEGTCKLLIHCTEDSSARDAIISMHTRNGGSQNRINFADGAGAGTGSGQFYYNHDGNTMYWITGGTENMTLDSSGNLTIQGSYSPSDGRLKENIEDFSYDIEKFKAYSPKTFDWINPEEHGGKTQQIGFIAQEQEAIDPRFIEEVETDADRKDTLLLDQITKLDGDVKGISKTSEFVQKDAMYISVIQQLIERLEVAETKISALEGGN